MSTPSVYDVPEFAKAISDGAISFEEAVTALSASRTVAKALQVTGLDGYCDDVDDSDDNADAS